MSAVVTFYCDRDKCETHSTIRDEFIFIQPQHGYQEMVFCSWRCMFLWMTTEAEVTDGPAT